MKDLTSWRKLFKSALHHTGCDNCGTEHTQDTECDDSAEGVLLYDKEGNEYTSCGWNVYRNGEE